MAAIAIPAAIPVVAPGRAAFPHEPRGSRRTEAPAEIPEKKLEPPYVGCHGSGVQYASFSGNSRADR